MKTNHTFSVLFWVNKSKINNGAVPIYARITVNGKRAELSLKRSIAPEKWNAKAEIAKGNSEESRILNSYIALVRGNIEKHYNQMVSSDEHITAETIKNRYTGLYEKKKTILEAFDYHNKMMEAQIGLEVVESTLGKYEITKRRLSEFMKHQYNRSDMALVELNHKFAVDFEFYLRTETHIIHNSAMKYIKNLKKVVCLAIANEWLDKHPFINYKCNIKEVERDFLTQEELDRLINTPLNDELLERTRDIFLFQCYTGYGYAEVTRLTKEHLQLGIDGTLWTSIQRKKTENKTIKKSSVPLLPMALQIVEKYKDDLECQIKGTLLPIDSNVNLNLRLKRIARACGINKPLTTHIGRHTFATTVTLANGVPIETVSSMLGHSSISTTQIYAKVVETKVSYDMQRLKERLLQATNKNVVELKLKEA
ncbi:MAG: site-specific integrase [Bacteroidota bacterium]|nr:site-specific integrase [Bacteroidota bacterium]